MIVRVFLEGVGVGTVGLFLFGGLLNYSLGHVPPVEGRAGAFLMAGFWLAVTATVAFEYDWPVTAIWTGFGSFDALLYAALLVMREADAREEAAKPAERLPWPSECSCAAYPFEHVHPEHEEVPELSRRR